MNWKLGIQGCLSDSNCECRCVWICITQEEDVSLSQQASVVLLADEPHVVV